MDAILSKELYGSKVVEYAKAYPGRGYGHRCCLLLMHKHQEMKRWDWLPSGSELDAYRNSTSVQNETFRGGVE